MHLLQLPFKGRHLGERRQEGVEHRPLGEPRPLLGEVPDAQTPGEIDRAAVGLLDAGDDSQNCRLAGAVRADETDAGLRRDAPVDALEDFVDAVGTRDTG